MKPNKIEWKAGNIVINKHDPIGNKSLLIVRGWNLRLDCIVEYLYNQGSEKNYIKTNYEFLYAPSVFGIKITDKEKKMAVGQEDKGIFV